MKKPRPLSQLFLSSVQWEYLSNWQFNVIAYANRESSNTEYFSWNNFIRPTVEIWLCWRLVWHMGIKFSVGIMKFCVTLKVMASSSSQLWATFQHLHIHKSCSTVHWYNSYKMPMIDTFYFFLSVCTVGLNVVHM